MSSWLWKYTWLHDKITFGSSLPFCCLLYVLYVSFSLLRWSSTCWCEHMRGTPVVNKEVMVPLLSHLGWILLLWAFFWGYDPCTSLSFNFLFWLVLHFVSGLVLATWWYALDNCKELSLNSRNAPLYYISVMLPLIMFIN